MKLIPAKGLITVLICLIVITPLCGFLFSCGCTWPWAGLAKDCNFYARATVQCPWCKSMLAGGLSVSLSIIAAYFTSVSSLFPEILHVNKNTAAVMSVMCALVVFLLVSVAAGWMAASAQGYAHFILKF